MHQIPSMEEKSATSSAKPVSQVFVLFVGVFVMPMGITTDA